MRAVIIGFGLMILCLLILFKIAEVNFISGSVKLEVIVAFAALIFFFAGIYFNHKQNSRQEQPAATGTPPVYSQPDYEQIKRIGLTQREHDVLVKLAAGMSNQEIASSLFLSESTIKTHVSNIFFKLDVKRRTQAIETARRLRILA